MARIFLGMLLNLPGCENSLNLATFSSAQQLIEFVSLIPNLPIPSQANSLGPGFIVAIL